MTLRKSIRKSVIEQSKLLHNIGTAEMEKRVQKQVLSMATKTSKALAEETGIQTSLNEDEMKDHVKLVINEINKKLNI
jgi:sensor histidine kinase regulating citrate/malate metabolism